MRTKLTSVAPEIVFGVVGAVGTDLDVVCECLSQVLSDVGYTTEPLHLIEAIHQFERWAKMPEKPLFERYESHMTGGNDFRGALGRGDAIALLGIKLIQERRRAIHGKSEEPVSRHAYLLRSLKHPEEVRTLRKVYGDNFFLVSSYSPRRSRLELLAKGIASSHGRRIRPTRAQFDLAQRLIDRDEKEFNPFGQNVQDTFPLGDVFVDASRADEALLALRRFVHLLFEHPFITPTRDEYAMFMAHGAALRSAALGRQVGAAISNTAGDVIALGSNEVPKPGGGLYWSGDTRDGRDFQWGFDTSEDARRSNVREVVEKLAKAEWFDTTLVPDANALTADDIDGLTIEAIPILRRTRIMNPIEFGRCEHAELAALLDAARRGSPVVGHTLYTTTFPCHECTRHIITAGIRRVLYIEPFPKSLGPDLHKDAISVEGGGDSHKVPFVPFVGVAPRQYTQLFTAPERKDSDGRMIDWKAVDSTARFTSCEVSYLEREALESEWLKKGLTQMELLF